MTTDTSAPRSARHSLPERRQVRIEPFPETGHKVILVVDDDPDIVAVVVKLLANSEYNILTIDNGPTALELSHALKGYIHLFLSDFQMPGMSGIDLATAITTNRPELKVPLTSGFPGGMLVLNEGWHFLAKPVTASQLRALITGLVFPDRRGATSSK
jgi:CheY-like chemotaxis protein